MGEAHRAVLHVRFAVASFIVTQITAGCERLKDFA
jgi:hypothetical protein